MGGLTLLTGGARSGKSRMAEQLAKERGVPVTYLATATPSDAEMEDRIRRHRAQRPAGWPTVEAYKDLDRVMASAQPGVILLDCVTLMITNLLMECELDWDAPSLESIAQAERYVEEEIGKLLRGTVAYPGEVLAVTNEIGMGMVPAYPMGRAFRDIAGRANQRLAAQAGTVIFMVSGLPLYVKGGPICRE